MLGPPAWPRQSLMDFRIDPLNLDHKHKKIFLPASRQAGSLLDWLANTAIAALLWNMYDIRSCGVVAMKLEL